MTNPILPPAAQRHWSTWYTTRRWRRLRAQQLLRFPLCAFCLARGITTPATIADHIKPHSGNWNDFLLGKLQSLCKPCHDITKRCLDLHGYTADIDSDGWPTDPRHPANQGGL
jgi:hypothetical protein